MNLDHTMKLSKADFLSFSLVMNHIIDPILPPSRNATFGTVTQRSKICQHYWLESNHIAGITHHI